MQIQELGSNACHFPESQLKITLNNGEWSVLVKKERSLDDKKPYGERDLNLSFWDVWRSGPVWMFDIKRPAMDQWNHYPLEKGVTLMANDPLTPSVIVIVQTAKADHDAVTETTSVSLVVFRRKTNT